MLVFVFTEDRGLGNEKVKVTVAPFAYDSYLKYGEEKKSKRRVHGYLTCSKNRGGSDR